MHWTYNQTPFILIQCRKNLQDSTGSKCRCSPDCAADSRQHSSDGSYRLLSIVNRVAGGESPSVSLRTPWKPKSSPFWPVACCVWRRLPSETGPMNGRREKRRFEKFRVLLSNGEEPVAPAHALTENLSASGIRTITDQPWKPDTRVLIKSSAGELWARVIYCQNLPAHRFALGLQLLTPKKTMDALTHRAES